MSKSKQTDDKVPHQQVVDLTTLISSESGSHLGNVNGNETAGDESEYDGTQSDNSDDESEGDGDGYASAHGKKVLADVSGSGEDSPGDVEVDGVESNKKKNTKSVLEIGSENDLVDRLTEAVWNKTKMSWKVMQEILKRDVLKDSTSHV